METTTLDCLSVGQPAVVNEVSGDEPISLRLRIMGICVGQGVHVIRSGNRMIVCAGGTRIGLSSQVAKDIRVRLVRAISDSVKLNQENS